MGGWPAIKPCFLLERCNIIITDIIGSGVKGSQVQAEFVLHLLGSGVKGPQVQAGLVLHLLGLGIWGF